jgi:hypothetical protein
MKSTVNSRHAPKADSLNTAPATESNLDAAKAAVGTLLESLRISAYLYAVEPRDGVWAIAVECANDSGWKRVALEAGPELIAAIRGDAEARATLLCDWREHLGDCTTD